MRNIISIKNLDKNYIQEIFSIAKEMKEKKIMPKVLKYKSFAIIFEKPSLRTRATFEIAIYELGGFPVYFTQQDIGLGKREAIKDVAKNLSRWFSGIIARVFSHQTLIELEKYSSIPIINALSDLEHPCQAIADFFTIYEKFDKFNNIKMAYIGDGNNVCHSLMLMAKLFSLNMIVATPKGYEPLPEYVKETSIPVTNNPIEAVKEADIIYTDVWTSMGQEAEAEIRKKVFKEFQVNNELVNYAKKNCLIMHCLPAHRGEEITSEVIDSPNSIVFDQAENRLHTQKALLYKLFE